MRRYFQYGGYLASAVLILFGAGTIAREKITATPDAQEIGVNLEPSEPIDTGAEAKEFAKIIRTHALEATGGRTYAEMGRFLTPSGSRSSRSSCAWRFS